mmetsp:Transcript_43853/g.93265  ORF Transcript_43853/g.93265 Transcript_43853/m.93265 type:complete len:417 (+) Transcript_43853:77-1327(+)
MSLLNSIFGEAPVTAAPPSKEKGTKPDLFGSHNSVPRILHKKAASIKKKREICNKEDSSSVAGTSTSESRSNDKDDSSPSDSAPQETPPEDVQTKNSTASNTKKSKEQLKEEEERTVFVGNLPPDINRKSLAGIFKPCGNVVSARLRSMAVTGVKLPPDQAGNQNMMRKVCVNTGKIVVDTPKKSAQGYVVFESTESIKKALQMNSTAYQSHTIRVDHANPTIDPSRSVFVGNLPYGADEETLREHFLDRLSEGEDLNEREGSSVSGVRIIRDKETQKCKGFGYVTLRDATLVPLALQLHGTAYMKRELRVIICGRRFKGNKGEDSIGNKSGRRSFEGQRATGSSKQHLSKRKHEEGNSWGNNGGGKTKKRRARSEKKAVPGSKPGMSKRAATEQKVNKRVKKLQKRVVKGKKNKK